MRLSATRLFATGGAISSAGGAPGPGGYSISKSLRFNAPDSSYLNRTPASAGNRKTWTWSGWVKRSALGTTQNIFGVSPSSGTDSTYLVLQFNSSNQLELEYWSSKFRQTTQVFRDVSAWYHIVCAFDSTQSTAANRVKLYVNGVQLTDFGITNDPGLNTDYGVNNTSSHNIGSALPYSSSRYLDSYLADIFLLDGIAADPSSFTTTDLTTGQLIPKAYTGSYGLVSVAEATGALPIFNTTGTYGVVKGVGTRTDSNNASIVLAVPMDGTNGGTSFGDQSATIKGSGSAKTVTVNGNTITSALQSKFYGSSGYFDGTGDYLTLANNSDFDFGSGNYTLEVWVYPTDVSTTRNILSRSFNGGTGNYSGFILSTSNFLETTTQTAWDVTISKTLTANTWQHLAIVRNGTTWTYYINGVSVGTGTASGSVPTGPGDLQIGRRDGQSEFQGYMGEVRIYKGVAKYTSNFTSVISQVNSFHLPFSDNSTTTALGTDTSGNGNTWTVNNFSVSNTPVYSNYLTTNGLKTGWFAGTPAQAFDSSTTTFVQGALGEDVTFTPPTSIPVGTSLRIWADSGSGSGIGSSGYQIRYNGTTIYNASPMWTSPYTITAAPGTSLSSLAIDTSTGGEAMRLFAVEIDGTIVLNGDGGVGNDSLVDTPTSYGTDTGVGNEVRGNYTVLNALNKGSNVTLSNGNLESSHAGSNVHSRAVGTIGVSSNKWYFEATLTTLGGQWPAVGVAFSKSTDMATFVGAETGTVGYYAGGGANGGGGGRTYSTYTTGDVIGVAIDLDNSRVTFYKNGANAVTSGTTYESITAGEVYVPAVSGYGSSAAWVCNYGQRTFAYTAPSGFKALVDTNLAVGTITTSGTFTGNANADGPFVYLNGVPTTMLVNGNLVTFATHADKLANGFKIRSASSLYNLSGSNIYLITTSGANFKNARAQSNP